MQNNYNGHHDHHDSTTAKSPLVGSRTKMNPVDEKASPETKNQVVSEIEKPSVSGIVTDCFSLNIREKPLSDAKVIAVIPVMENVLVDTSDSTDDFYKICTAAGVEGYCMKKYIALRR